MQIFDHPEPEPAAGRGSRAARLLAASGRLLPAAALGWLRRPVAWMVGAEIAICALLLLAVAHVLAGGRGAAPVSDLQVPPAAPASTVPAYGPVALPSGAAPAPSPPPHPGLDTGPGFLRGLIAGLNGDEAAFEHDEWAALQALSTAIRAYLEDVILPAVERAAHSRPRPPPT